MYNILIADDDSAIREGIAQIVTTRFGDRVAVCQAANGMEAVELACMLHVDVIVTDIKMPVCSGIDMMGRLRDLDYQGELIVISGFDDYSYVRQAMKLGAADYILKPVNADEFSSLLESCLERAGLKAAEPPAPAFYPDNPDRLILEQQYCFRRLLEGDDSFAGGGKLAMIAIGRYGMGRQLEGKERLSLYLSLEQLVWECFGNEPFTIIQGEQGSMWGIAVFTEKEIWSRILPDLSGRLKGMGNRFGISASPVLVKQAPAAWQEAVSGLEQYFYDLPPLIEPDQDFPFHHLQNEIVESICGGDMPSFIQRLHRLFGLFCYRKIPIGDTRQLMAGLVYDIMRKENGFISIIGRYKFTEHDVVQIISDAVSASEMRNKTADTLSLYMNKIEKKRSETANKPGDGDYAVQRVIRFIEEGYRDEISLAVISRKLDLHPNYLSTLFRQKTGITYGQYVRRVRVEKAKELIAGSNMKMYTVADRVGYKDNAHFYRAFKEETGLSPAQYKKAL